VLGLLLVWLIFATLKGHDFVKWDNQRLMLLQTAVVGAAAMGSALIIFSGGIDLSVGSSIALTTVVIALSLQHGFSPVGAVLCSIVGSVVCGLVIGAMIVGHAGRLAAVAAGVMLMMLLRQRWGWPASILVGIATSGLSWRLNGRFIGKVPLAPFIVTLGMLAGLRGAAKGLADNQAIYPADAGWISGLLSVSPSGLGSVLPPGVWLFLGLALLMSCLLRYTLFGRHVYAVGSNERTARLCGVPVDRTKIMAYALGVGCAGVAGVLQYSFLSMGDPTTAGGYELKAIASVVIGGASLAGGEGGIIGTLVGALVMTVVDNGCTKLGLDNWVQEVVTGAIIVIAVGLDRWRHRSE
jgi:ribose/xylose/arabinose/galactoside ABC-type transport system permease subunit